MREGSDCLPSSDRLPMHSCSPCICAHHIPSLLLSECCAFSYVWNPALPHLPYLNFVLITPASKEIGNFINKLIYSLCLILFPLTECYTKLMVNNTLCETWETQHATSRWWKYTFWLKVAIWKKNLHIISRSSVGVPRVYLMKLHWFIAARLWLHNGMKSH